MEKNKCYAAIDIGSNAVRLLIKEEKWNKDHTEKRLEKELLLRVPLRLGFDVFATGKVSGLKVDKLRRLMKSYRQLMKIYEVDEYRACATSAMRDAKNSKRVIERIEKDSGIRIEVINGVEEAKMVYGNHIENQEDRVGNFVYVDVGGGSTEINLLSNGELIKSCSYNIGTVRMLNNAVKDETWTQLQAELSEIASKYDKINIVGSGGNINKLSRLADKKSKTATKQCISITALQELYNELAPLSVEDRMEKYNLKPDRADVIVPAAQIFLAVASAINAEYIQVPVIGLADGIIDVMLAKNKLNA